MVKEDSLYDPPTEKKEEPPVPTELPPTRARARTIRSSVLTLVIMLSLLGLAAYVAYLTDQKGERPEFEDVTLEDLIADRRTPTNQSARAELMLPDMGQSLDQMLSENSKCPRAPQDPEELAVAMQAIRVAHNYARAKEWDLAELQVRRALEIWPAMNVAQRILGVIYTQKGQFEQAIMMLSQALTTDPFSAETYSNLAAAYMHKGQLEKAEAQLNTALKIQPDFAIANLNLGLLYLSTGRYNYAADYLELALEKMPGHSNIRNNLAVSLLRIGRYEDSRHHLQTLIDADESMAHAYFNMAITYTLEGDFKEALNWIEDGSRHCSPIAFQQFVSDPDFQELQTLPEFQSLIRGLYGELPEFNS
jgi:Flp pilus assembly protein TadD